MTKERRVVCRRAGSGERARFAVACARRHTNEGTTGFEPLRDSDVAPGGWGPAGGMDGAAAAAAAAAGCQRQQQQAAAAAEGARAICSCARGTVGVPPGA
eukprot:3457664-Prymnesium_polylepis.1